MLDDAIGPKAIFVLPAFIGFAGFEDAIIELIDFFGEIGLGEERFGDGVEPLVFSVEGHGDKKVRQRLLYGQLKAMISGGGQRIRNPATASWKTLCFLKANT